jgi:mxaC protein
VLLFDRSASMNDTFAGRPPTGEEESKSAAARRFLKTFVANREHDRFGVAAFSTAPMFVLPLSDHKDATLAAIDAIELPGLALTDVGRGLVMAQAMQEADILNTQGDDSGLGTRAIVLVSDGAAVIDRKVQEKLQAAFAKRPIRLYWIFLRAEGSRGIFDLPKAGDRDTPYAMPERHLNMFFEGLKVPYQAFEVENPVAVGEAIAAIDKLERSPIRYVERIPQRDLSAYAYGASALALLLLVLAKLAETKVSGAPGVLALLLLAGAVRVLLPAEAAAAEMNRDQVLALIATGGPDYGPDLTRKDLTGLDLSGVDFKRADLFAADLSGASVARANLAGANLNRTIMRETDLRDANLSKADMFAVVANGANFSGADLFRRPHHRRTQGSQSRRRQACRYRSRRRSRQSGHGAGARGHDAGHACRRRSHRRQPRSCGAGLRPVPRRQAHRCAVQLGRSFRRRPFRAAPSARVDMLYNMANARLRLVFDAIEQGQFDKATSLIGLAKDEYVDALRLDPNAWNVKFNLDVTSRLLRDLPEGQGPEDKPREAPKELWTDIPGTPRGAP